MVDTEMLEKMIKNLKENVLPHDDVESMSLSIEHGVFGTKEYEVQLRVTKNDIDFVDCEYSSADLHGMILELDKEKKNFDRAGLLNHLGWGVDDFERSLSILLKKGDIIEVNGKLYPLESMNLY